MFNSHLRKFLVVGCIAAVCAVSVPETEAQTGFYNYDIYGGQFARTTRPGLFGWLRPWRRPAVANYGVPNYAAAQNVAYSPVSYGGGACNTCNPCTTCASPCTTCARPVQHSAGYAPVTSYRLGFTRTAYRPVSSCDSCGNRSVSYQAYRTLLPRLARIPVTNYRPTYAAYAPQSPCNTCNTGFSNPVSYAAPASSGCSSCSVGSSPVISSGSSLPAPSLRPVITDPTPTEVHRPTTPANDGQQESRLKALPQVNDPAPAKADDGDMHNTRVPRLFDPRDKTARLIPTRNYNAVPVVWTTLKREVTPQAQPIQAQPITSHSQPIAPQARPIDDGGWVTAN